MATAILTKNKRAETFFIVLLAAFFLMASLFSFLMYDTVTGMAAAENADAVKPASDNANPQNPAVNDTDTTGQNYLTTADSGSADGP